MLKQRVYSNLNCHQSLIFRNIFNSFCSFYEKGVCLLYCYTPPKKKRILQFFPINNTETRSAFLFVLPVTAIQNLEKLHILVPKYNSNIMIVNPVWKQVRILPLQPCKSQKAIKREPGAWGYNWATLSPGPPGWGLNTKLTTLLCAKITVAKSKE